MDALSSAGHDRLRLSGLLPLGGGLLLLCLLWLGPLADMARTAFSPHMILHLGVVVVAAPLLVIGAMRLLPGLRPAGAGVPLAIAASALEFVVVWGWHLPALHEEASRWQSVFMLQQASFLGAGLLLWWACLAGRDAGARVTGGFAMLFTAMHMAMLGVLFVLAPDLVYAAQFCLGAFGLEPMADQQFGGGLMALFGALPLVVGGAWLASLVAGEDG